MAVINMRAMQIHVRPEQFKRLQATAKRRGLSMSEVVRQGIDCVTMDVPLEEDPLWNIIGIVDSGPPDLSEKLDEYLVKWMREEAEGWGEKSS